MGCTSQETICSRVSLIHRRTQHRTDGLPSLQACGDYISSCIQDGRILLLAKKWTLEEPTAKVMAAIPAHLKSACTSNLLLMIVFLLGIIDHAEAFLRYAVCFWLDIVGMKLRYCTDCIFSASSTGERINMSALTSSGDASKAHVGNCFGIYGFSWDSDKWNIGRVATQPIHKRMSPHGSHDVNRITREYLDIKGWVAAKKCVLVRIPEKWKNREIPMIFFTKIVEPVYIAFAMSTLPAFKMQMNILDSVGVAEKASFLVILRGWEAVVRYVTASPWMESGPKDIIAIPTDTPFGAKSYIDVYIWGIGEESCPSDP